MIDRNKIPPPQIRLTEMAAQQLQLMLDHDPTLQGKCMRIHVEGKGCKGFRYVLGIGRNSARRFYLRERGYCHSPRPLLCLLFTTRRDKLCGFGIWPGWVYRGGATPG